MPRACRLLGVMVPDRYRAVTSEMFELFKTCWEPVQDDVDYEVILCHSETAWARGPAPDDRDRRTWRDRCGVGGCRRSPRAAGQDRSGGDRH